jgi:uncharacterized protein DUF6941
LKIEIFTLCDAAADYIGRLSILGVFDTIFAPQVPAVHPHCSVALRMRFAKIESGAHKLTLHIVDEDGKLVIPTIEGAFNVEMPANSEMASANLVLNIGQLKLESYGEYGINLAIDSIEQGSLPFWLKPPPKG